MSIEGQGHFFTIYFPGFYFLCFTNVKISGERLQDQWSSGFVLLSETDQQNYLHASMRHNVQKFYKMQSSMKSRILTDSFQCWPEMTFF